MLLLALLEIAYIPHRHRCQYLTFEDDMVIVHVVCLSLETTKASKQKEPHAFSV
jgi:hypothetical protein